MELDTSTSAAIQPKTRTWYAEYAPHQVTVNEKGNRNTSRNDLGFSVRDVQTQLICGQVSHLAKNGETYVEFQCNTIGSSERHRKPTDDGSLGEAARCVWKEWNAHFPWLHRTSRFWWRHKRTVCGLMGAAISFVAWWGEGGEVWMFTLFGSLGLAATNE